MDSSIIENEQAKAVAIVKCLTDYIEKNYTQDVNMKTIASEFNMNAFYLGHMFKNITGETYTSYVNKLKIDKAKELLSDPTVKVSDVATKVGYLNTNYLFTFFKKLVGVSPVNYALSKFK